MDTAVIGVVSPTMQADLDFSPEHLSWVFDAYAAPASAADGLG